VLDEYDRVCRPSALDETPCSVAEQRQNASLNRYFNVLPFDFNRVKLQAQVGHVVQR
jgi:protein tyrosine phosphatase